MLRVFAFRLLMLLLLSMPALAQEGNQEGPPAQNASRPRSNSIPLFDHAPGEQNSIPATGSVPSGGKPPGPGSIPR